ncbi:MAG: hypothetical protein ABIH20_01775 [Candidatus Diapherotrites archaeon]
MKLLSKKLFPLKNGNLFAMLEVQGRQGDRIKLSEQGISGQVIFYSEAPKRKFNCVNCPNEGEIELGGSEKEGERTLYLIVGKSEDGTNEGERTASSVRS